MAKRLKRMMFAGSVTAMTACAPNPSAPGAEAPPAVEAPAVALTPEAQIAADLERLSRLEVMDMADLFATRTEHGWIPYGNILTTREVPMEAAEVAERLEAFTVRAEAAVAAVDGDGVSPSFEPNARCFALGGDDGAHCLTIDLFEADLAALNALEIIEVEGIVADAAPQSGGCYSSWVVVSAAECTRAHQLHAIVEATADLPASAIPPENPMIDGE